MLFSIDKKSSDLIKHNKSIFKKNKNKSKNKIFLVEFNGWQGVQIANSYLINTIPFIRKCNIVAFESYRVLLHKTFSLIDNIKWFLGSLFKVNNFGVYSSFCVDSFIYEKNNNHQKNYATKITNDFFKTSPTKKDIENYTINKVWIGDLIYDSYLKKYNVPTIDLKNSILKEFFERCILNFLFWEDYFNKNIIKGVTVCHAVYIHGIPARIAVKREIPVYAVSDSKLFKIDKKTCSFKNKTTGIEYQHNDYRKIFKKFSQKEKKKYLRIGKDFLESIIKGKKNYFYFQNKKKYKQKSFFEKNNRPKIVIYVHSFFDSPHLRENFLFPDFFEWLNFIAKIAKKTNYDWYIKPHPNYEDNNKFVIDEFVKKNPFIKKISLYASNLDLVKQGLKYALTIYGSCASELPYLGVKVVNADPRNPHSKYNFSLNPKSKKELERMILNLKNEKLKFSSNELFEYHYMNQFYFHNNYLFNNIGNLHKRKNGRQIMYSKKIHEIWLKDFTLKKHKKIQESILKYDEQKDYLLSLKHTSHTN